MRGTRKTHQTAQWQTRRDGVCRAGEDAELVWKGGARQSAGCAQPRCTPESKGQLKAREEPVDREKRARRSSRAHMRHRVLEEAGARY